MADVLDPIKWKCHVRVDKYHDGNTSHAPDEVTEVDGNLLLTAGAAALIEMMIGNGTATAGNANTFFSSTRAFLGVGDSTTAAAAGQTDLQAATNKTRAAVTTVNHTGGAASVAFVADFTGANYAWQEWGVFNATSGQTMLNRGVSSLGTKATGTWTLTITISLA